MGFKDWLLSGPAATYGGLMDKVLLYNDRIESTQGKEPLAGATARVESGSAAESHLTLGGVLKHGAFSDKARKTTGGESCLVIEGPGFYWSIEVARENRKAAVDFAAKVTQAAKKASA